MKIPNIPIKKSNENIKFYKEVAPEFDKILYSMAKSIQFGVTDDYNRVFKEECKKIFSAPLFPFEKQKNNQGKIFGNAICLSVNDEVAHTKPVPVRKFKDGDIISIDCGLTLNELHFDAAFTVEFGVKATLDKWYMQTLKALKNINDSDLCYDTYGIAEVIDKTRQDWNGTHTNKLGNIVSLTGHGIGYNLHEAPLIHNMSGDFLNTTLVDNLVLCVEPLFSLTKKDISSVHVESDSWSIVTNSGEPASHYETMYSFYNGHMCDLIGMTKWEF